VSSADAQLAPVSRKSAPVDELLAPASRKSAPVEALFTPVNGKSAPVEALFTPVNGKSAVECASAPVAAHPATAMTPVGGRRWLR